MAILYIVGEIKNNIKLYTEQGWKMAIVYTVGEIRNNYLSNRIHLPSSSLVLCIF
jgi:hypothetical protein